MAEILPYGCCVYEVLVQTNLISLRMHQAVCLTLFCAHSMTDPGSFLAAAFRSSGSRTSTTSLLTWSDGNSWALCTMSRSGIRPDSTMSLMFRRCKVSRKSCPTVFASGEGSVPSGTPHMILQKTRSSQNYRHKSVGHSETGLIGCRRTLSMSIMAPSIASGLSLSAITAARPRSVNARSLNTRIVFLSSPFNAAPTEGLSPSLARLTSYSADQQCEGTYTGCPLRLRVPCGSCSISIGDEPCSRHFLPLYSV